MCCCECQDLGRTYQHLQDRICQHVPKTICNKTNQERIQPMRKSKINSSTNNCDSAIGTHLLKHPNCALHYNDDQFSILSKARSEFYLAVLESIHITSSKPALCRQKEFIYSSSSQTFFVHGALRKLVYTRGALMKPKFANFKFYQEIVLKSCSLFKMHKNVRIICKILKNI